MLDRGGGGWFGVDIDVYDHNETYSAIVSCFSLFTQTLQAQIVSKHAKTFIYKISKFKPKYNIYEYCCTLALRF